MIQFRLNGEAVSVDAHPMARLLSVLRRDLRLTGTKEGCGEGECGACSVVVDGKVVNSCLIPMSQIDGTEVLTIEGSGHANIQDHFLAEGGTQCGICTPGMIMATRAFLEDAEATGAAIDEDSVRAALAGNLCRCTGYGKIVAAVLAAARTEGDA